MTWLNPWGLIGLVSLPVILVLHLLRERQRRYIVSDLSLWAFLDHEARGPRTRRLPITPLLLLDLLIAALLSLAWAQPRLSLALSTPGARHQVLLLDVSTSMSADDGLTTRFEGARNQALALLESAGPNDIVTLLAFGREARLIGDSRQADYATLIERLAALQAGETVTAEAPSAFHAALAMGAAALDHTLPAEFHIYTDGSFPDGSLEESGGFGYPLNWHWIGPPRDNQAVIELNMTALGPGQMQVFTRFANFGARPAVREAVLEVDGRVLDQAVLDLPAESSVAHIWPIAIDAARPPEAVTVSLRGGDDLAADDSAAAGLHLGGTYRVALVAENPGALQQAVQAIPGAELTVIAPQEYAAATVTGYDLTIFRDFVPEVWPTGQTLVVEPPSVGDLLASGGSQPVPADALVQVPQANPYVAGVDFSGVRWGSAISLAVRPEGFAALLQAADVPLLLQGQAPRAGGSTRVLVLLADLSRGNFTRHPAFPILMANLVTNARSAPLPPAFQTGEPVPLPSTGSYQAIQIVVPGRETVELEGPWPAEWTDTVTPGLYQFRLIDPQGATRTFFAGGRAGDAEESDLRPRPWTATAEDGVSGPNAQADLEDRHIDLWIWLLAAALLALVAEAALAWRRA